MRKANNLPPSCAAVTKSGNLNFLEPCGPVQACNGTALPFICYVINHSITTIFLTNVIMKTILEVIGAAANSCLKISL